MKINFTFSPGHKSNYFPKLFKKYTFLTILLFTSTSFCQTATVPAGAGTVGDPYQIATLENLYWVTASNAVVSSPTQATRWASTTYYIQTADIDASATSGWNSGAGWEPIGISSNFFMGKYDGNGHIISGLYINRPSTNYMGLFGDCANGVTITNLGVTNVNITGSFWVGALVAAIEGNGIITNCYSTGLVYGNNGAHIGGLVGNTNETTISNCYSSCDVAAIGTGQGVYVGGFAGVYSSSSGGSTLNNCYATGTVRGYNNGLAIGGFVGNLNGSGTVYNCYSSGDVGSLSVPGAYAIGGFVGYMHSNTIRNCYSTGNVVNANQWAGGFVGYSEANSTITNCFSSGNTTRQTGSSQVDLAGFIGNSRSTISNCYSTGSIIYSGTTNPISKGFVGTDVSGSYSNNFFDSETSIQSSGTGATAKTTALMKTQSTFTDSTWDFTGESTNGNNDYWTRADNKNGGYPFLSWQTFPYTVTLTDGSGFTPSVTAGQTNQAIGRFAIKTDTVGASFSGIWIQLNGTRTNATNFKIWESSDNTFSSGTDTQLGSTVAADPGDGNYVWFLTLAKSLATTDKHYFITCDLASNATGSIQPIIVGNKELLLGFSTVASTLTNVALSSGASPLPVELTSFAASVINNNIRLNWQTATEVNNFGFEIERASTPLNSQTIGNEVWKKIGFVAGHGNSNSVNNYSFTDTGNLTSKVEYRLKQLDNDGSFKYSPTVESEMLFPTKFELHQNFPNPFNPQTSIQFELPVESLTKLIVFNSLGEQVVTLVNGVMQAGLHNVQFNANTYTSGLYFYKLQTNGFVQTKKMILMK